MDEDVDVVEGNFHAFGISNKVRREISAIELHAANLGSVAGDAQNEAAVADNSSVFHMSQNAVAYCSKLSSHISRTPIARLKFVGLLSPSCGLCMMGNPVDGGLRKGTREKRPLLRSRFAQSPRTYCAEGITSKSLGRARRGRPELRTDSRASGSLPNLTRPEPRGDKPSTKLFACAAESTTFGLSTKPQSNPAPRQGQHNSCAAFIILQENHSKLFPFAQSAFRSGPRLADSRGTAESGPNMAPASAERQWKPRVNPWVIAGTVALAAFMEVLDTSIANVALPHISGNLGVSTDDGTWVLTSYLVSNAIVLPMGAWASSVIGRERFFCYASPCSRSPVSFAALPSRFPCCLSVG